MPENIVLLVGGKVVRDDADVVKNILLKAHSLSERIQKAQKRMGEQQDELNMVVAGLKSDVEDFITDVEARLSLPQPDISGAIASLQDMRSKIQSADKAVEAQLPPEQPI